MAHIVLMNDSEELLEMLHDLLEGEGYETTIYSYAIEEMKRLEELKPDLLILDIIMGASSPKGWATLQKVKLYPPLASIPIIVCTAAEIFVREQEGYLISKGVLTLLKPFDIDELLTTVNKALHFPSKDQLGSH
jgi:CheY-like chemotaxis protein